MNFRLYNILLSTINHNTDNDNKSNNNTMIIIEIDNTFSPLIQILPKRSSTFPNIKLSYNPSFQQDYSDTIPF